MLFNSFEFIVAFLPFTLAIYFLLGRLPDRRWSLRWLLLASLFFYAWWNPANLAIIVVSIGFNYFTAQRWIRPAGPASRKWRLGVGIAVNLALLGYFKYANFFVDNWNAFGGAPIHLQKIVLPIAISFFTFQQIVFLVEAYRGQAADYDFLHYAMLVTFFPHLIAGPIVHYREMLTQFTRPDVRRFAASHMAVGVTIFSIGLFKKVVLADGVAPFANAVFGAAHAQIPVSFGEAWIGALAYTFQLYFDFSGYSDMAIGLARMIGVRFPMNFNSPYKSVNIIDFWRRWHITLSRFLRDYLYIPLGGNRKGPARRHLNLLTTMLLGGLWHGAGWTFVIWGGLHGLYLMVNHFWHALRTRLGLTRPSAWGLGLARAVTFGSVVVAWVFFRATSFPAAQSMLEAMFLGRGVAPRGMFPNGLLPNPDGILRSIALLAVIAWFAPNTQELLARYRPALGFAVEPGEPSWYERLRWRPSYAWSVALAVIAAVAIMHMWVGDNAEFLYFQF
jgi:alginate O-acetyltransferase complex protein AlgI